MVVHPFGRPGGRGRRKSGLHNTDLHNTRNDPDQTMGEHLKDLVGDDGLCFSEDMMDLTFQCSGYETEFIHGTCHPGELCQKSGQVPRSNHGEDPTPDEPLPCLVGGETNEGPMNEFPPTCDARKVRHDVIHNDQQEWESKPNNR